MDKIVPHFWFESGAEEAVALYTALLPDSRIDHVTSLPSDTPSGPAGSVQMIEFTLIGERYMAMNAGKLDDFNHAISFVVPCKDQAEIDRLWSALGEGGMEEQCGWLRDRWGVAWQIVPARLGPMMRDPDPEKVKRVTDAFLKMVKFNLAALERAYAGESQ